MAAAVLLAVSGCGFRSLRRDLEASAALGTLQGQVHDSRHADVPIVVFLYAVHDSERTVVDSFALTRPGGYFFVAPEGTYGIAAFRDHNRNFSYDADSEAAAHYGEPSWIELSGGSTFTDLDIRFDPDTARRIEFPFSLPESGRRGLPELPDHHIGEIATLDDPRFSKENGNLGLWKPVEFLFDVGAGIYFLEEFDEDKIPVVFIHGATGHPGQWRYLIERMDRQRFQPWLMYYPSAFRIEHIARALHRWLQLLAVKYEFKRLGVVAHSMGGLVARSAINLSTGQATSRLRRGTLVFVSISTPWSGHSAAALGVKHAPAVAPSWDDMAPDSEFLQGLFESPLRQGATHYLLFGYKGRRFSGGEATDRTVTLASQLRPEAQFQATKVYGFNESHVNILSSSELSRTLNEILSRLDR